MDIFTIGFLAIMMSKIIAKKLRTQFLSQRDALLGNNSNSKRSRELQLNMVKKFVIL